MPFRLARPLVLAFVLGLAGPAPADTLVTVDGRVIEVVRARAEGDHYRLQFPVGEILCPKELVASVEIEGDMSDYVPKDEKEREYLEKGFVRHRGRWISKEAYRQLLDQQSAERKKRTEELARLSNWANALQKESKYFIVRTNTSQELLDFYADLLDAYYALMDDVIGIDPTPTMRRTKLRVNVYKRHDELRRHAEEGEDIGESVLGYFSPSAKTLNFFHDYKDPNQSIMVGLHECTHLLTYLIDQDYLPQIWINEAVADYFGMATVKRDARGKLEISPGKLQMDQVLTMQQAIRDGTYTKLADLFLVEDERFDGFQYANAWSFVYFLQQTPAYAKPFNRFFKDCYTLKLKGYKPETLSAGWSDKTGTRKRYRPADVRDAFLKQLKVKDVGELEKQWIDFVQAIPIDAPEALFLRGRNAIDYGEGSPQQALDDLNAAIDGGFDDARAFRARGIARILLGKRAEALADLNRAIELDPLDAQYRAELAWLLSGWWNSGDELVAPATDIEEASRSFALAACLDPTNDELLELDAKFTALRRGR